MFEVKEAPGIIWHWHIDHFKPTAVEVTDTDTAEVSQPKVASTPPAPIQLSTPPNVNATVLEISEADQPETVSVPTPVTPEVTPVSSTVREQQYPGKVHRVPQRLDLWIIIFLFFLETVDYGTLLVDYVCLLEIVLRLLSYKLGTGHFCV